jgi:secondary thiamine-phosphate synthase enzyme
VNTEARSFHDISLEAAAFVKKFHPHNGTLNIFIHHTSASLIICENADPSVRRDLNMMFAKIAPDGHADYEHDAEGPDDMPAHIRSVITQSSITIPIQDGKLDLGTWQGLYLWEHRTRGHRRRISFSLIAKK